MGMKAFCPLSQIDKDYCENPEGHLNKTYTFEIIQFDEESSNIVVSRKEYLQHEAKKLAEELWKELEEGDIYEGIVSSVQNFGAFVDIGGIQGLLHVSEISYERVENAADVLKVGQTLEVAVKSIDRPGRGSHPVLRNGAGDPRSAAPVIGRLWQRRQDAAFQAAMVPAEDGRSD